MTINEAGLTLIKEFEGFRAETYKCSAGVLTIGYGTTAAAGVGIDPKPGMRITEPQATEYLAKTVDKFAAQIRPVLTREPNENQWAAMVSLAYNIGPGAFAKSSVARLFNAGDDEGAAAAFLLWNKAKGKVLKGLSRRREAERALFLSPVSKVQKVHTAPATSLQKPQTSQPGLWAALINAINTIIGRKAQ